MNTTPLDLSRLRVLPLAERDSLTRVEDILLDPDATPRPLSERLRRAGEDVRRQDPSGTPVGARASS